VRDVGSGGPSYPYHYFNLSRVLTNPMPLTSGHWRGGRRNGRPRNADVVDGFEFANLHEAMTGRDSAVVISRGVSSSLMRTRDLTGKLLSDT